MAGNQCARRMGNWNLFFEDQTMSKVHVEVEKYVKVTVDVDVPEAEDVIGLITGAVTSAFMGKGVTETVESVFEGTSEQPVT